MEDGTQGQDVNASIKKLPNIRVVGYGAKAEQDGDNLSVGPYTFWLELVIEGQPNVKMSARIGRGHNINFDDTTWTIMNGNELPPEPLNYYIMGYAASKHSNWLVERAGM